MHISWLGGTAVKIQTKPNDEDIIVVIDPYKPDLGSFPRSLTPHIALYTHGVDGSVTLSGEPFVLATPGECETKGVLMTSGYGGDGGHLIVRIDAEGMSLAHMGLTNHVPTESELELIGAIDILILPIGGGMGYDPETAAKVVNAIEPKVVIPVGFKSDNDPKLLGPEIFLRELGAKAESPETKVILKKKDLPAEETQVVVLKKE
jgi:L-ascorbate metabolism protein UlaG (beta-lactamase superfamily)